MNKTDYDTIVDLLERLPLKLDELGDLAEKTANTAILFGLADTSGISAAVISGKKSKVKITERGMALIDYRKEVWEEAWRLSRPIKSIPLCELEKLCSRVIQDWMTEHDD